MNPDANSCDEGSFNSDIVPPLGSLSIYMGVVVGPGGAQIQSPGLRITVSGGMIDIANCAATTTAVSTLNGPLVMQQQCYWIHHLITPNPCGDGVVDGDEECDPNDRNANLPPGQRCTDQCRICGNNIATAPEQCDGMIGGGACRLAAGVAGPCVQCTNQCTIDHCGNGVKDMGEDCDIKDLADRLVIAGRCTANCTEDKCGNGVKDPNEKCDPTDPADPNKATCDGIGAAAPCQNYCGDGQTGGVEKCDNGVQNDGKSNVNGVICMANCTVKPAVCGDAIKDPGEDCDLGDPAKGVPTGMNGMAGSTCSKQCKNINVCPAMDGVFPSVCSETGGCANFVESSTPLVCGPTGVGLCGHCQVCGDGKPDVYEECDHGAANGTPGDTCDANCHNLVLTPGSLDCTGTLDADKDHYTILCSVTPAAGPPAGWTWTAESGTPDVLGNGTAGAGAANVVIKGDMAIPRENGKAGTVNVSVTTPPNIYSNGPMFTKTVTIGGIDCSGYDNTCSAAGVLFSKGGNPTECGNLDGNKYSCGVNNTGWKVGAGGSCTCPGTSGCTTTQCT